MGTDFKGFQIQKKGTTIQKLIQTVLKKILKEKVKLKQIIKKIHLTQIYFG